MNRAFWSTNAGTVPLSGPIAISPDLLLWLPKGFYSVIRDGNIGREWCQGRFWTPPPPPTQEPEKQNGD